MKKSDFEKWLSGLEASGYNHRFKWGKCGICGLPLEASGKVVNCGQKDHIVIHANCGAFNGKGVQNNPNNKDTGSKADCTFTIRNCDNAEVLIGFVADCKYYNNLFGDEFKVVMPTQKSLSSISKWFDVLENNNISFTYELVVNGKHTTIEKACPKRVTK